MSSRSISWWRMAAVWCGLCLAMVGAEGAARADVVMPAPKNCPYGSTPTSSHCGPECLVIQCKSDKDCRKGTRCQVVPLCVSTIQRSPCGRVPARFRNKKYAVHRGRGPCTSKLQCPKGATCQTKWKVCVPPIKPMPRRAASKPTKPTAAGGTNAPTGAPKDGDCSSFGVRAGAGGGYLVLSMLVVFFLMAGGRRRK